MYWVLKDHTIEWLRNQTGLAVVSGIHDSDTKTTELTLHDGSRWLMRSDGTLEQVETLTSDTPKGTRSHDET